MGHNGSYKRKISKKQEREIWIDYLHKGRQFKVYARAYGVTSSLIGLIINNRFKNK